MLARRNEFGTSAEVVTLMQTLASYSDEQLVQYLTQIEIRQPPEIMSIPGISVNTEAGGPDEIDRQRIRVCLSALERIRDAATLDRLSKEAASKVIREKAKGWSLVQSIQDARKASGLPSIFGTDDLKPKASRFEGFFEKNVEGLVDSMAPTLQRALQMQKFHDQKLIREKGFKASNYRVCAACGTFLYADIYGGSQEHYKVSVPNRPGGVTLCVNCGHQLKQEMKKSE